MTDAAPPKRPAYGLDAPYVVRNLLLVAAAAFAVGVVFLFAGPPWLAIPLVWMSFCVGLSFLACAGMMLYGAKVGKLHERDRLLNLLPWRGDEQVLDVGCGRGLLLVGAAKRTPNGKAVGIDVWQKEDLADNRPEATRENVVLEGVGDRVEVKDGDARRLAFPDATFDAIVSRAAIHNIYDRGEREQAVREVARVLKPGGHVAISDVRHTGDYVRVLRECGLSDVRLGRSPVVTTLLGVLTFGTYAPNIVLGRKPTDDK